MGFGMAGLGLNVMHDANHGALSKNKSVNHIMSYTMNIIGGSSFMWKLQHNVLHHSFTNIEGSDSDMDHVPILRFSPHKKWLPIHRFQFVYAWFLYKKMGLDKTAVYLLIGLTLTFITLAIPIQFEGNFITLFWAAEAVILLWLAQKRIR